MIIAGIVLLVAGFLFNSPVLSALGLIVLIVGLALVVAGRAGHAVRGRRHYY
jgi:uncharacterized membrane protein HdeD (DUF308 family)